MAGVLTGCRIACFSSLHVLVGCNYFCFSWLMKFDHGISAARGKTCSFFALCAIFYVRLSWVRLPGCTCVVCMLVRRFPYIGPGMCS